MRRADVGLLSFQMQARGMDLIKIKVYHDGTLIRIGAGGLPPLAIGAVSYWPGNDTFDRLMAKIPPQLLLNDINYVEQELDQPVVYELQLGAMLTNGLIGEQAQWGITRTIRLTIDVNTKLRSPVLAFLDSLLKDAMGLTNNWYFDALILAIFDRRSNHLPPGTLIAKPESDDLKPELANFLSQCLHNPRRWNFMTFPENKIYVDEDGKPHRLIFKVEDGKFNYFWT